MVHVLDVSVLRAVACRQTGARLPVLWPRQFVARPRTDMSDDVEVEAPGWFSRRARWGAMHKIHERFADGFPLLAERFAGESDQANARRFVYNLGCRRFASDSLAWQGMKDLKSLFRQLDVALADPTNSQLDQLRLRFSSELAKWAWRRGARLSSRTDTGDAKANSTSIVGSAALSAAAVGVAPAVQLQLLATNPLALLTGSIPGVLPGLGAGVLPQMTLPGSMPFGQGLPPTVGAAAASMSARSSDSSQQTNGVTSAVTTTAGTILGAVMATAAAYTDASTVPAGTGGTAAAMSAAEAVAHNAHLELMRIMRSNALLSGALGLGGPGALAVGGIGGFPGTSPVTSLLGGTPPAPTAAGLQLLSPPLVHVPPILQQAQAQMMDVHVLASVEGAAPAAAPTAAIAPNLPRGTEIGAVDETSTSAAARARAPSPGLPPKKRRRASET